MSMRNRIVAAVYLGLLVTTGVLADQPEVDTELAKQGVALLKTYCQKCHGNDQRYPGLDVLNRTTLLSPVDKSEEPFARHRRERGFHSSSAWAAV